MLRMRVLMVGAGVVLAFIALRGLTSVRIVLHQFIGMYGCRHTGGMGTGEMSGYMDIGYTSEWPDICTGLSTSLL